MNGSHIMKSIKFAAMRLIVFMGWRWSADSGRSLVPENFTS